MGPSGPLQVRVKFGSRRDRSGQRPLYVALAGTSDAAPVVPNGGYCNGAGLLFLPTRGFGDVGLQ